jgi:hypothetical protein
MVLCTRSSQMLRKWRGVQAGLTLAALMMGEKEKLDGIGRDETGYKLFKVKWVDPSAGDD